MDAPSLRPEFSMPPDQLVELDAQTAPALRCRGMSKRFPGVVALSDFDFDATAGEVHALLGENGAGKSTFIKGLGGSVPFDSGTVELFGEPVRIRHPGEARRHGIEIAYQELSVIPDLSVARTIWLRRLGTRPLRFMGQSSLRRRTLELYDRLQSPHVDPDLPVRRLSVAERQLVEVIGALATDPRIVVFDEPTAALPAEEAAWVLGLARRLAEQGKLVLFISHRLQEVDQVADRVTVMRDGRAVLSAPRSEVDHDYLVESMLGRKGTQLYPPRQGEVGTSVSLKVEALASGDRLSDITFELREGEILGVGGLQGQGQSSLLYALFGLSPYRGQVTVSGQRVHIRSPAAAFRAGVGLALVPEDRRREGLIAGKSVRENVALPVLGELTRFGFMSAQKENEVVAAAIARLDVRAADLEQPVTTLSGGNQQKVVIAKLLLLGARILLFHDLTRGIDVGAKAQIFALLRDLTATGHSVLFYSSDNEELVRMCDRVLVLSRGRLTAILDGDRLSEAEILRAAFGAASADPAARTLVDGET
jgi:ribose transport system ATP-binding protein